MKSQAVYIAGCVWGKNPDDFDSDKDIKYSKGMPGRDYPATDEDMRGFYG